MQFNRMQAIGKLNRILTYGRISPWLRKAVAETVKAIKNGHLHLAADLTSVKSLVEGREGMRLSQFKGPFAEDHTFNQQVLGESVYGILDGMHSDLSYALREMPSGTTVFGFTSPSAMEAFGASFSQAVTGRQSSTSGRKIDPMKDKIYMTERGESFRRNVVVRKIEEEKERIRREVGNRYGQTDQLMRGR